jgi:hypothetical protein
MVISVADSDLEPVGSDLFGGIRIRLKMVWSHNNETYTMRRLEFFTPKRTTVIRRVPILYQQWNKGVGI